MRQIIDKQITHSKNTSKPDQPSSSADLQVVLCLTLVLAASLRMSISSTRANLDSSS
ncbi:hypothetical protein KSP40_PGU004804 [Platanthera guangdongensis]|uniref:Uncharacterized protein n=1 Tax=Platanthera guangdongensis TaxID=2320717 RepID=A0ABR2N0H8_9ASPA